MFPPHPEELFNKAKDRRRDPWRDHLVYLVKILGSKDVAKRLDVSYWTVLRWLKGERTPLKASRKRLGQIARALRAQRRKEGRKDA